MEEQISAQTCQFNRAMTDEQESRKRHLRTKIDFYLDSHWSEIPRIKCVEILTDLPKLTETKLEEVYRELKEKYNVGYK